jgi:hypothetical protein
VYLSPQAVFWLSRYWRGCRDLAVLWDVLIAEVSPQSLHQHLDFFVLVDGHMLYVWLLNCCTNACISSCSWIVRSSSTR